MFKDLFKWLFCKHTYKYYNTRVEHFLFSSYGYNVFQFVCTKCGDVVEVSQIDIDDAYSKYKAIYNKSCVLGKEPIKSSELTITRHMDCNVCYSSPATTLLLEEYAERGIDLTQINTNR